jgi:hypothetical protein
VYFLIKSKKPNYTIIVTIIGIFNIVLYTFLLSKIPFNEHSDFIESGVKQHIAFWLHYISLGIVVYLGYQIYHLNKEKPIFEFFKSKYTLWIVGFFIICIASSELMLHSLFISGSSITNTEAMSSQTYLNTKDVNFAKELLADKQTNILSNLVVRTGYPILWGIIAFGFLIFGIKNQNKSIRIIALALLGLTIVKLFLYDIRNASETGKIVAFILLGILILIISFVYQKIKVLVLDDAKPIEKGEKNETE